MGWLITAPNHQVVEYYFFHKISQFQSVKIGLAFFMSKTAKNRKNALLRKKVPELFCHVIFL